MDLLTLQHHLKNGLSHPKVFAIVSFTIAGCYFSALQLSQSFAHFHTWLLNELIPTTQFVVTPDPTDLIALPFLFLAYRLMLHIHLLKTPESAA